MTTRQAKRTGPLRVAAFLSVVSAGCVTRETDRDATIRNDTDVDLVLEGTLVKRLGRICADDDDLEVTAADLPDPPS